MSEHELKEMSKEMGAVKGRARDGRVGLGARVGIETMTESKDRRGRRKDPTNYDRDGMRENKRNGEYVVARDVDDKSWCRYLAYWETQLQ